MTTRQVDSTECDKLRLMNTNCGNEAATWTQNGNLILLTVESDWYTQTASGSAAQLRTRYCTKGFRMLFFWSRQYYSSQFREMMMMIVMPNVWVYKITNKQKITNAVINLQIHYSVAVLITSKV